MERLKLSNLDPRIKTRRDIQVIFLYNWEYFNEIDLRGAEFATLLPFPPSPPTFAVARVQLKFCNYSNYWMVHS